MNKEDYKMKKKRSVYLFVALFLYIFIYTLIQLLYENPNS